MALSSIQLILLPELLRASVLNIRKDGHSVIEVADLLARLVLLLMLPVEISNELKLHLLINGVKLHSLLQSFFKFLRLRLNESILLLDLLLDILHEARHLLNVFNLLLSV